ncbi:hypothetical protein [Limnoglobus roseus]|uniref:hypothetical protein n=1 Tax=Limnoglobus roseus TaxID=2598579 RepID=UPI0011EAA71D|nr:hypothetical protein [Limnoglobus roseus]
MREDTSQVSSRKNPNVSFEKNKFIMRDARGMSRNFRATVATTRMRAREMGWNIFVGNSSLLTWTESFVTESSAP